MNLASHEQGLIVVVLGQFRAVERAVLFGSRALGCARPESDVDLAVTGNLSDSTLGLLTGELEELPLPYRFDVQRYDNIRHAGLRRHIDQHGIVIYQRATG